MSLPGNGTAANPLGDLVAGQIRIFVEQLSASAVTAVRHTNGRDYWVVASVSADVIHAYRVSSTGVDAPVISNGMINLRSSHNMKFSSDGRKFVSHFIVADFDPSTGVFSNVYNISQTPSGSAGLTVRGSAAHDFSPNSGPVGAWSHGDIQLHTDGNLYYLTRGALAAIIDPNNSNPTFDRAAISITMGGPGQHVPNFVTS